MNQSAQAKVWRTMPMRKGRRKANNGIKNAWERCAQYRMVKLRWNDRLGLICRQWLASLPYIFVDAFFIVVAMCEVWHFNSLPIAQWMVSYHTTKADLLKWVFYIYVLLLLFYRYATRFLIQSIVARRAGFWQLWQTKRGCSPYGKHPPDYVCLYNWLIELPKCRWFRAVPWSCDKASYLSLPQSAHWQPRRMWEPPRRG